MSSEVEVIRKPSDMQDRCEQARRSGQKVVLVPTMGYLHEGHLSLCRIGRKLGDVLIVSIFVNPTQFGVDEDLDRYPRDITGDLEKAASCGVDLAFVPGVLDMYPPRYQTFVEVEKLARPLCGVNRPTHFKGVATVVSKLFNIVRPHVAVFGEKDYQQLQVIRRLTGDMNFGTEIVAGPTFREPDGVAMSSRNAYLTEVQRRQATCLSRGMGRAAELFGQGERQADILLEAVRKIVEAESESRVDYIELRHPETLEPLTKAGDQALLALAVFFGDTRLIDNTVLGK